MFLNRDSCTPSLPGKVMLLGVKSVTMEALIEEAAARGTTACRMPTSVRMGSAKVGSAATPTPGLGAVAAHTITSLGSWSAGERKGIIE